MTERLYERDAYLSEFDAEVVSVTLSDNQAEVVLAGTVFFPEEGGQSCDRGTLAGLPVTHVRIENGVITHTVSLTSGDGAAFAVGATVHGCIDFEFRFRNMQMHSGEHIFSGLVHRNFGYSNVGFHLSENSATMDYNGVLTKEDVAALEFQANRAIIENHVIRARYPDEEELKNLSYRSKKEIDGPLRLVEIEGVDLCACCATHVRSTAEIGCLKIVSLENYKGGVRLNYVCGFRAMEAFGASLNLIGEAGRLLSANREGMLAAITKLKDDNKDLSYRLVEGERNAAAARIREQYLKDGGTDGGEALNARLTLFLSADGSLLRFAADTALTYYAGGCNLFFGKDGSYRFLLESKTESVTELLGKLKKLGAKGGGAPNSVTGSISMTEEAIRKVLA